MLTLIIPPDWPQERRDCPWLVLDDKGRILRQGCSEPAQWPTDEGDRDDTPRSCLLLLAGRQVSCQQGHPPKGPAGYRSEVIGSLLEEQLLDPPEHLAYAVGEVTGPDDSRIIGVVSRPRLAALVELLRQLGLTPIAAWPLGLVSERPCTWCCGEELNVVTEECFIALPINDTLAEWLSLILAQTVLPLVALDRVPEREQGLLKLAGQHLQPGSPPPPLRIPTGTGFLDGELAPPRPAPAIARHFRPALRLATGFAVALIVVMALQWSWNAIQIRKLEKQIASHFLAAQPNAPMVDPVRQLQRHLDQMRRSNGQLVDDDFLMLASSLEVLGSDARLLELRYENGRMSGIANLSENTSEAWRNAAAKRKQQLVLQRTSQGIEFILSPGER